MELIEKTLNNLVEQQFPAFYRTDGPVFVAFVKEYYKWLEQESPAANRSIETKGIVSVNSQSMTVTGRNTSFEFNFANGDSIAISADSDPDNYNIYTIDEVVNNSVIVLAGNTLPEFSSTNSSYYVVRDQKNPNYYARRQLENKDVDATAEEFLVYFKEKYLKNIQFETQTNTRLLLKRALDLYRSKGTPRSIDLLFKIVFGVPASVYYPGQDVFRTSDGQWYKPRYIEVSLKETNVQMVNKQIEGLTSGATAFCEAVVRKTVKGRFVDVLYISAINGNFQTGEVISCPTSSLTRTQLPTMIGSLTTINVNDDSTGIGYTVGDVVTISSASGEGATARITEVANVSGVSNIALLNGGYAYTVNADVWVSDRVLLVTDAKVDPFFNAPWYFEYTYSPFVQPLATIQVNQGNGLWTSSANVFTYHANNLLKGTGRVISYAGNTSVGNVFVAILSGNLDSTHLYTTANAIGANIIGFTDNSVHGNLFATSANLTLNVVDSAGSWSLNEIVYQDDPLTGKRSTALLRSATLPTANGTLVVSNTLGIFKTSLPVTGNTSGAVATVDTLNLTLGVKDLDDDLISSNNNYVYWGGGLANATIDLISDGNGASFEVATLSHTEVANMAVTLLSAFGTEDLANAAYGLPAYPAGNGTNTPIMNLVSFASVTMGKIATIDSVNPGSGYSLAPFIKVYEPLTADHHKMDTYTLTITGPSGSFTDGEVIEQAATGARGLITSSNSTALVLERLSWDDVFIVTSNSTTTIAGDLSGVTANVDNVDLYYGLPLGYNANVGVTVTVANGAIVSLEVIDSGFGFREDETLVIEDDSTVEITASLGHYGQGAGFYKQLGGVTSGPKKIFDGLYYQDYSYEVRSSITLNRYEEMLKQLLHISGTKYFGAFIYTSVANNQLSANNIRIQVS